MRVHVVQPALPAYRIPFFRSAQELLETKGISLCVYASRRDQLGVESVSAEGFAATFSPDMSCMLNGTALWQGQLQVPLKRGDALVLNGNPRILSNYPLWLRAKSLGVPVIWWGHGWSAGSRGAGAALRRRIMRLADGVILYTDHERAQYLRDGFFAQRTFALNNGIDVEAVNRAASTWTAERLEHFRRSQGLDRMAHWCVFIGRQTVKSEIGLLIECLPMVRSDTGLIVLGGGVLAADSRRKAGALALSSRIVWAGAVTEEISIAPWMRSAELFVYPGSVGLSLIHAFAYGLPAVVHSSFADQQPEYAAFSDGGNGRSFHKGSASSLAAALNALLGDPAQRQTLGQAAKALTRETYNTRDMAARFVAAVVSLTAARTSLAG